MKATRFAEYGAPEVLDLVEVGEPHAGPGQIRIAVRAAGVNAGGIHRRLLAGDHGARVSGGGGDRRAALAEAASLYEAGRHVAGRTVIVVG